MIDQARIVSAYTKETMTDMMGRILRPALARMEREEIAKRTGQAPKGKGVGK